MSLQFSEWNSNNESVAQPSRKRVPTIGRESSSTRKIRPGPETIDELKEKQVEQNTKINGILNRITSFSNDDRLGDFNPMPYPAIRQMPETIPAEENIEVEENPLMPSARVDINMKKTAGPYYRPASPASPNYTNYSAAYNREGMTTRRPTSSPNDKLMERINYMTQMLESLQMEKTNHVTEEFILYTLLGVFMIYIVDGFSRGGKYVR
jgi:hypothetical protein